MLEPEQASVTVRKLLRCCCRRWIWIWLLKLASVTAEVQMQLPELLQVLVLVQVVMYALKQA